MDHHGAALAEPRPCGHWKASPVSPPVRVLYRAPLKRAIQVRWSDPNSGPFLPAPGPRGDVIVKNSSGAESTSALLRNPRVLQTLGDLAVNAAATGSAATITLAPQPAEDDQAVVAVHSATASDGRYLQVERALKAPTLQPAEVDRFFGRRVDCSCQTDDLPLALPHVSPPEPVGAIAPPAILKRTRLLAPPTS
ncbi:hypothetical protein MRX96_020259 [Rhipicephalus microplus]